MSGFAIDLKLLVAASTAVTKPWSSISAPNHHYYYCPISDGINIVQCLKAMVFAGLCAEVIAPAVDHLKPSREYA